MGRPAVTGTSPRNPSWSMPSRSPPCGAIAPPSPRDNSARRERRTAPAAPPGRSTARRQRARGAMKLFFDFLPIILFFGVFKVADMNAEAAARYATDHLGFVVSGGVVGAEEAPVLLATVVVIVATLLRSAPAPAAPQGRHDAVGHLRVDRRARRRDDLVPQPDLHQVEAERARLGDGARAWLSQAVFGKNLLQALIGQQLELPTPVWQRLNFAWIVLLRADGRGQYLRRLHLLDLDLGHLQGLRPDRADARLHGRAGLLHRALPEGRRCGRPARGGPAAPSAATADERRRPPTSRQCCAPSSRPDALEVHDDSHLHAGHAGAAKAATSASRSPAPASKASPGRPSSARI